MIINTLWFFYAFVCGLSIYLTFFVRSLLELIFLCDSLDVVCTSTEHIKTEATFYFDLQEVDHKRGCVWFVFGLWDMCGNIVWWVVFFVSVVCLLNVVCFSTSSVSYYLNIWTDHHHHHDYFYLYTLSQLSWWSSTSTLVSTFVCSILCHFCVFTSNLSMCAHHTGFFFVAVFIIGPNWSSLRPSIEHWYIYRLPTSMIYEYTHTHILYDRSCLSVGVCL